MAKVNILNSALAANPHMRVGEYILKGLACDTAKVGVNCFPTNHNYARFVNGLLSQLT